MKAKLLMVLLTFILFGQASRASSAMGVQRLMPQKRSTGFPGIKVDLVSCQRYGRNVRIDFKMKNVSSEQSSFVVYGTSQNIPEHKSAFVDDQGNAHKGQVNIMNQNWTSVHQQVSIPAGITVNGSVMVEDVPKTAKSIALFDLRGSNIGLEDDFYQVTGRDFPISPYSQDGSNGLEYSELSLLKIDYKLSEWKNGKVHIRFVLTNVGDVPFACRLSQSGAISFDEAGNRYDDCSMSLNGENLYTVSEFSPHQPVVCDAYLTNVPASVNFLQQFMVVYPYEDWKFNIGLMNLSIAPEVKKQAVKSSSTKKTPTRYRRK